VYALADDELGESVEAYALREITGQTAVQVSLGLYEREDVARAEARARARGGSVGTLYRIVAVMYATPDRPVAVAGGARRRAVRTLAHASVENSLSRFGVRVEPGGREPQPCPASRKLAAMSVLARRARSSRR